MSASSADGSGCASRVVPGKLALHSLKALWNSGIQLMGLELLTLGPERTGPPRMAEVVCKEVKHVQKQAELTGGLERVAVLS